MSWLKVEQMMPDNFRENQAPSYTNAIYYETGVPSCESNEGVTVNKRCVPTSRRFTEVDMHPHYWQEQQDEKVLSAEYRQPLGGQGAGKPSHNCAPPCYYNSDGDCVCVRPEHPLDRNEKYQLLLGLVLIALITLVCLAAKQA